MGQEFNAKTQSLDKAVSNRWPVKDATSQCNGSGSGWIDFLCAFGSLRLGV